MISVQLENILKTKFDIDNHKLNMQDSLEQNIVKFTDIIKDNFKGSKMIDESMVHTMKEVWEAISERFKALNLQKHQKQAQKDAQNWISSRFSSIKASPKKNDELLTFYDQQLQLILQIHSHILDQNAAVSDLNNKKE